MCSCLNVSRSVYYYQNTHLTNKYKEKNIILDKQIKEIFNESNSRYGSPKITKVLNSKGIKVSQKRVSRRMKMLELRSITIKKFKPVTNNKSTSESKEYHNLLKQNFKSNKPGEKWLGDITYIYTKETGWTYLAIVIDLFDLKVIGWEYSTRMTDEITIKALKKAVFNRQQCDNLIFHSDRGSQYISNDYEVLLKSLNIKHSYSKKGYPYDNASMESFNAILKKEEVNLHTYCNYEEARLIVFQFIESWYNNKRIHGSLGYITPNEKYQQYLLANC